ncbi:16S rRNA (guanine966-N2)-methyltransferase [Tessaracoccus bendigoensis DSM 12906]|uniref:16S rRNA (Guanine966-N2)-methyltransferase n=1 Tax=Tessaracoccus bendigoensis DSM 12906 TaxID=1123357 RepID=A0A1M6BXU1_9ACTN|nr:16S rRNA (guanine966-N2)-methyltransferase [Tessaracoccus bendigoensis DSM 12906]
MDGEVVSRIISGSAKGRRLATPKGDATRPTTDRTREALFSALVSWFDATGAAPGEQLSGIAVLDLFAGSGAVGLEAASRGADPVVLVEADRPTMKLIEHNARTLGLRAEVRAVKADVAASSPGRRFDLVFLDPPYDVATDAIEDLLVALSVSAVAPRGLVVVERSSRDRAPSWPAEFTDTWERRYGETTLYYGSVG